MTTRMLPGAHRPEGALSWLGELLANEDVDGVVVVAYYKDQSSGVDPRVFGSVRRHAMATTGAILLDYSVGGEFEEVKP